MNKKLLTVILVLIMSISIPVQSFAESKTTGEMVEILDAINVFKGDERGYNLNGKLRRSEAATLIVRLLGKTSEVDINKAKYSNTRFSDVKKDDWFSHYVGYCEANDIIAGFPDGTFRPNEYITEKAFTQLVLGVLGYTSNSDFNWDSVLKFSLETGLNEDVTYAFKTSDNDLYTRGDAVGLIYRSLDKNLKNSTKKVIDLIIGSGLTSYDAAVSLGIYKKDNLKSKIDTALATSKNTIKISFNEDINFLMEDLRVKLASREIKVKSIDKYPTFIEVILDENMEANQDYSVSISSVTDLDNNTVKNLSKEFKGFEEPRVMSSFFKISKVEPLSNDRIKVYFTHPVDESAKQVLLYEFQREGVPYFEGSFKSLKVTIDSVEKDAIIITASGYTFDGGTNYGLKIRGDLKSIYGAHLNKGEGDSMSFVGTDFVDTSQTPEVLDASFLDKDLIRVTFSNIVDEESAKNLLNYRLTNNKNSLELSPSKVYFTKSTETETSEAIIRFSNTNSTYLYNLKVKDIYDINRVNKSRETVLDVGQGVSSSRSPEIIYATPLDRMTIEIIFDMKLKPESENASIMFSNGLYARVKKVDEENPYKMLVYLSKVKYMNDSDYYKLTINGGLIDEFDRRQRYSVSSEFPGFNQVEEDTRLESASFISNNLVMAKFNKDIRIQDFNSPNKFDFIYREGNVNRTLFATSAKYIDSKTVIVGFDYLLGNGELSLVAKDFYNITGETKYNSSEVKIENYYEVN